MPQPVVCLGSVKPISNLDVYGFVGVDSVQLFHSGFVDFPAISVGSCTE